MSSEVFDNGVRQDVELLDAQITRLNTLLLLDISRSVQGEKYRHLSAAVKGVSRRACGKG